MLLANGCTPIVEGADAESVAARRQVSNFVRARREAFARTHSVPCVTVLEPAGLRSRGGPGMVRGVGGADAVEAAVHLLNIPEDAG